MTSYNSFSHMEPHEAKKREIYSLFNKITPCDLKHDMMAILFLKLHRITLMLAFPAMYLLCRFDDAGRNISRFRIS